MWENEVPFKYYQHEVDFNITGDYGDLIASAIEQSHAATNEFGQQLMNFLESEPARDE